MIHPSKLLASRREGQAKASIRAEIPPTSVDAGVAVLRLYDPIDSYGGFWGVSAKEFLSALDELPTTTTEIRLHVNSPGGEVWEGVAILNALRNHPARIVAIVDGIAASAASFVTQGADEVVMGRNSEMMIHNAWGICIGDSTDMRKLGDDLERMNRNIASVYAGRAGGKADDWLATMAAETWYSDAEAVAAGLADRIETGPASADSTTAKARFDLSVFAHAGRADAPDPTMPDRASTGTQTPAGDAGGSTIPNEGSTAVAFTDEQLTTMRQALGVDDGADEATILDALAEALDERTEAPAAAMPEGVVTIDEQVLADLRADATAGREARDRQQADSREHLVAAAVQDGRIRPASRDAWLNKLTKDPDGEAALAELSPGLVPVAAAGYTGGEPEPDSAETVRNSADYKNWSM